MKYSIIFLILLSLFIGCSVEVADYGSFEIESGDSNLAVSRSVTIPSGLKVAFRSSDIEFWASHGDYSNLHSDKYGPKSGANISTEVTLSDNEDNVLFMKNKVKLSEYNMPEFNEDLYDVARMDIGNGDISFTMNGNLMNISSSKLGSSNLNANSIVFIDRNILSEVVYISRTNANEIFNNTYINNNISNESLNFVKSFIKNCSLHSPNNDETYIDIDGALFMPFDAIDTISKNVNKIKIKIKWDLDDIFESESGGVYTLKDTADGTPYDFEIEVEIK